MFNYNLPFLAKCKCVDWMRDWYVIVTPQLTGVLLGIITTLLAISILKHRRRLEREANNAARSSQQEMTEFYQEIGSTNNLNSSKSFDLK